jgi:hypothetical protein
LRFRRGRDEAECSIWSDIVLSRYTKKRRYGRKKTLTDR